jgi:hypothetical protein
LKRLVVNKMKVPLDVSEPRPGHLRWNQWCLAVIIPASVEIFIW